MSNKKESSEEIVCERCGKKGAQRKYITRSYGKGATLLVIENFPVISCPSCGETYMTAATAHEIVRIKLHRKSLAGERKAPVAAFTRAA